MVHISLPTALTCMDSTTGEVQAAALAAIAARIPERARFEQHFGVKLRAAVVDRYGANLRVEKGHVTLKPETVPVVSTCDTHKVHSAVKHAMQLVDSTVSGAIHSALAFTGSGSLGRLRDILQRIFDEELRIIYAAPPVECLQRNGALLDMFCPVRANTYRNSRRQYILRRMCNSDWDAAQPVHFCDARFCGCESPEQTQSLFLQEVVWALLPNKLPMLQRKSWTGADQPMRWLGLLHACWGLLGKVVARYTGRPQASMPASTTQDEDWQRLLGEARGPQQPDNQAVEEEGEEEAEQALMDLDSGKVNWAAINRQYSKKAAAFSQEAIKCEEVFVVIMLFLQPALSLVHAHLDMSGPDWDKQQQYEAACGKPRTWRAAEKGLGTLLSTCFARCFQVMLVEPAGIPVACYIRRSRSLLFRLFSTFLSAVHFSMRRFASSFPWQLFTLLKDESHEEHVFNLPGCLRDPLAEHFFSKYTLENFRANSKEALALLEFVASMLHIDISSVEATHSSTREDCMGRARGHTNTLTRVSAKYVFRRFRNMYGSQGKAASNAANETDGSKKRGKMQQRARHVKRNTGAWRAFLSERCSGNGGRFTKQSMRQLKSEYENLSHDEFQHYYELGLASSLQRQQADPEPSQALALLSTDLVLSSPGWSMQQYGAFLEWQLTQRKQERKREAEQEAAMKKKLAELSPSDALQTAVRNCGGPGLQANVAPMASSSSSVEHHVWTPPAQHFAQVAWLVILNDLATLKSRCPSFGTIVGSVRLCCRAPRGPKVASIWATWKSNGSENTSCYVTRICKP